MDVVRELDRRFENLLETLVGIGMAEPDDQALVVIHSAVSADIEPARIRPKGPAVPDDRRARNPVAARIPVRQAVADGDHGVRPPQDPRLLQALEPVDDLAEVTEVDRQAMNGDLDGVVDETG